MQRRAENILDCLREHADKKPQSLAFVFLRDGEREEARLTWGELDAQARPVAAYLQSETEPGDRVLLAYPPGLAFIVAFVGSLYAGVVPVPVSLPRHPRNLARFLALSADCGAKLSATDTATATKLGQWAKGDDAGTLRWIATDAVDPMSCRRSVSIRPETPAFLQYTSGSTGRPKGVIVTHGNLMANERTIELAFEHSSRSVGVGWLPLFHDMGLIGNVLQPLYVGFPIMLMSPVAFLQKPIRWLKAISDYRGTTSGAPDFAYAMCAQAITESQQATLDLSSWDVAFTGAEPVRADTLDRFAKAFARAGFRPESFFPCYGMAETTLLATGGPKGSPRVVRVDEDALARGYVLEVPEGTAGAKTLVSSGRTWEDLRIVDPVSCSPCAADVVGEIWLRGSSVAAGYFGRGDVSEATFGGRVLGGDTEAPYLRSGDLGFLSAGELVVTGRSKDLIIIRGKNHYPHDIERTVELSNPALEPGGSAAFSIEEDGEERLVVVQEVSRSRLSSLHVDTVITDICRAVTREHDVRIHEVRLIRPKTLPRTSSGKLQRGECRSRFLAGELDTLTDASGSS